MSHISKKELKQVDHLTAVGRNAFEKILKNQKMVLTVGIILFSAGAGYVAWDKATFSKELSVQEEFYAVEKKYLKLKESFEKAEAEQKEKSAKEASKKDLAKNGKDKSEKTDSTSEAKESEPKKSLPTGELMKDYGDIVEGWNKLIDAHPSSKAASMAALELSQLHLKYKSSKDALQVLTKVKNQQNSDSFLGAMVFHSYAKLLANQGQCQEAVTVWEGLEKKKSLGFLVEEAQMGRALCLETLGQVEKAETLYKEIAMGKDGVMTPSKASAPPKAKNQTQKTAEKYLRYMKIKKGMGGNSPT